jgi:hypothetical protein
MGGFMTIILDGTTGISTPGEAVAGNLSYTGTLTGNGGIVNIGSGQVYKDASGNVGIGTTAPSVRLNVSKDGSAGDAGQLVRITDINTANSVGPTSLTIGMMNHYAGNPRMSIAGTTGLSFCVGDGSDFNGQRKVDIDSSGNLLVGYTASNGAYKLQVNSQIFATSSTVATSDGKYKKDVIPLSGALADICSLRPVQFSWKSHPIHAFNTVVPTVGFIAQEVQQVLSSKPYLDSIVKCNECTITPEDKDEDGNVITPAVTEEFLGIAEGNLIALLAAAIQELHALVKTQESTITALTTRITALEAANV